MLVLLTLIVVIVFGCVILIHGKEERLIDLENGQTAGEGVIHRAENGFLYCAFLGIPYAKPPIKELRFEVCPLKSYKPQVSNFTVSEVKVCKQSYRRSSLLSLYI